MPDIYNETAYVIYKDGAPIKNRRGKSVFERASSANGQVTTMINEEVSNYFCRVNDYPTTEAKLQKAAEFRQAYKVVPYGPKE